MKTDARSPATRAHKPGRAVALAIYLLIATILVPGGAGQTAQAAPFTQEDPPSRLPYDGAFDMPYLQTAPAPEQALPGVTEPEYVNWSKLVFQSARNGHDWEIYTARGDGSNQVNLSNNSSMDTYPRLSRDATRVVFASNRHGNYEIFVMNASGSGQARLTTNDANDVYPAWSPDGTKIAYQSYQDGQAEIYVMNANGSGQIRLTTYSDYDGQPAWSPDGTKIAFVRRQSDQYRIWVMNADGSNAQRRSNQPISELPIWSPDGSKIAYDADGNNDGWQELWLMDAAGGNQGQVYDPPQGNTDAWAHAWSPDGRYVAFTRISWVQQGGNWYWTQASLDAWDSANPSNTIRLSSTGLDWHPDWRSTDLQAPSSSVQALPAQSPAAFTVRWSGADTGGSGLKSFDVQVRDGAGAWTDLRNNTTETSASFTGIGGHSYFFRSRARDIAGNLEPWPADYDAMTTVEALAPSSAVLPLPATSRRQVLVRWAGSDSGGSGIQDYDVQVRSGSGAWTDWQMATTGTSAVFTGAAGVQHRFRVRARDRAQNLEAWPASADAVTLVYSWAIRGRVTDNRGVPVVGVGLVTAPAAFQTATNDTEGQYFAYVAGDAASYTATWSKAPYGALPATAFRPNPDPEVHVVLPPADNVVQNWGFENGATGWQFGGTLPAMITTSAGHSGSSSALLGSAGQPLRFVTALGSMVGPHSEGRSAIDAEGGVHAVWVGSDYQVYYRYKPATSTWINPEPLSGPPAYYQEATVVVDSAGTVHVVWCGTNVYHSQKPAGAGWSAYEAIPGSGASFYMAAAMADGSGGVLKVVWVEGGMRYSQRNANGQWSPAQLVTGPFSGFWGPITMITGPFGSVHLLWQAPGTNGYMNAFYMAQDRQGGWSQPTNLSQYSSHISDADMAVDSRGAVHVVWGANAVYYRTRSVEGPWSAPSTIAPADPRGVSVFADDLNGIHVTWGDTARGQVRYTTYVNQIWSSPVGVAPPTTTESQSAPIVGVDGRNRVHVIWLQYVNLNSWSIHYSAQLEGGWSPDATFFEHDHGTQTPQLLLSRFGTPHALWDAYADGSNALFYAGPELAQAAGEAVVSQGIHVPEAPHAATLSFLYQLAPEFPMGSRLEVSVRDGISSTVVVSDTEGTGAWVHRWVDLAPWADRNVDLSFRIVQAAGGGLAWATIDEVTAGSAYPDIWVNLPYRQGGLPGQQVVLTLNYGNRGGGNTDNGQVTLQLPSELTFVSSDPPPAATSPILRWDLGEVAGHTSSQTILVTLRLASSVPPGATLPTTAQITSDTAEPEQTNNADAGAIYVGGLSYLPLINR